MYKPSRRTIMRGFGGAALVGGAVIGLDALLTTAFRFRVRMIVSVGGKWHEGSSVFLARYFHQGSWLPEMPSYVNSTWGEAIVVDLDKHGLLFGLVSPVDCYGGCYLSAPDRLLGISARQLPQAQGEHDLRGDQLPALIRFRETRDPTSVELVDRLDVAYGPDVSLKRVSISITSDPVTVGTLSRALPWWDSHGWSPNGSMASADSNQDVPFCERSLFARLRRHNFELTGRA
jgi:hypothetical protein